MPDDSELSLAGKIANFKASLSAHELTDEQAAAALASIHADLENPQGNQRTNYEQYAYLMQFFHQKLPDLYEQVVSDLQGKRPISSDEEHADEKDDEVAVREAGHIAKSAVEEKPELGEKDAAEGGKEKEEGGGGDGKEEGEEEKDEKEGCEEEKDGKEGGGGEKGEGSAGGRVGI